MNCPDCKGSGEYVGANVVEVCLLCNGSGQAVCVTTTKTVGQRPFGTFFLASNDLDGLTPGNWYFNRDGDERVAAVSLGREIGFHVESYYTDPIYLMGGIHYAKGHPDYAKAKIMSRCDYHEYVLSFGPYTGRILLTAYIHAKLQGCSQFVIGSLLTHSGQISQYIPDLKATS